MKEKKGLTLIELLAVIAIIATLFVLLIPQINTSIYKARLAGLQTDFRSYDLGVRSLLFNDDIENIDETKMNKNLDTILHFENGVSKNKTNAFKQPYQFAINDDVLKIHTTDNSNPTREFHTIYWFEDGELQHEYRGFDEEIYGEAYCNSLNLKNDGVFEYKDCNSEITIERYIGTNPIVVIPEKLDGKKVVAIADSSDSPNSPNYNKAFSSKGITKITFPNTIRYIGDYAFGNNDLTSVTIPPKVKKISGWSFYENDIDSLILHNDINYIGPRAFMYNKISSLTIPNKTTMIDEYAFSENLIDDLKFNSILKTLKRGAFAMNYLEEVVLPSSLETLERYAFENNDLRNAYLPASLSELGGGVFGGSRENILFHVHENNPNFKNSSDRYGVYSADGKTIIFGTYRAIYSPEFSNVTHIGERAFYYTNIHSFELHEGVVSIGDKAFYVNPNIISVTLPSTLTNIGVEAFLITENLKIVINRSSIPNSELSAYFYSAPVIEN